MSPSRSAQEIQNLSIGLIYRIPEASLMAMFEASEKVVAALGSLMEVSGLKG